MMLLLLLLLILHPYLSFQAPVSTISIVGAVYCEVSSDHSSTVHRYLLKDAAVHLQCKLKKTHTNGVSEYTTFASNLTTNSNGIYQFNVTLEGLYCVKVEPPVCVTTLLHNTTYSSNRMYAKIRKVNLCVYSMDDLNYRTAKNDSDLSKQNYLEQEQLQWLPPPLPFPFNPLPPPFLSPPSHSLFDPKDPTTWLPLFLSPPPPRGWIPPGMFSPPPSPRLGFNPLDPRTWIPKTPFPPPHVDKFDEQP